MVEIHLNLTLTQQLKEWALLKIFFNKGGFPPTGLERRETHKG